MILFFLSFSGIPLTSYQTIILILQHFNCAIVTTTSNNRNKTTGSITERVTHIELQKQRNNFGVREFADKRKEKTSFINREKRTNED